MLFSLFKMEKKRKVKTT